MFYVREIHSYAAKGLNTRRTTSMSFSSFGNFSLQFVSISLWHRYRSYVRRSEGFRTYLFICPRAASSRHRRNLCSPLPCHSRTPLSAVERAVAFQADEAGCQLATSDPGFRRCACREWKVAAACRHSSSREIMQEDVTICHKVGKDTLGTNQDAGCPFQCPFQIRRTALRTPAMEIASRTPNHSDSTRS